MNKEFNLIFYHRETKKKYLVKWVTRIDFIILDPETNTKMPISKYALHKNYMADKANSKPRKKVRLEFKNWNKKNAG